MIIHPHFPISYPTLTALVRSLKFALPVLALLAVYASPTTALTLTAQVADGAGGKIVVMPGDTPCAPDCVIETYDQTVLSLFALPDEAYRFQGWEGACADTIGPLCTLKPGDDDVYLSARFVKVETPLEPIKALLLLHGENAAHTVWNALAERYFNNRCPLVYGGVVLGADSLNSDNGVSCYRIAFGYYAMLDRNTADAPLVDDAVADRQLAFEIRAAVLGLLNRHPDLSLTLVAQQDVAAAAQSFLRTDTAARSHVAGLLALQAADDTAVEPLTKDAMLLERAAEPEQTGKIGLALTELTKSWWAGR